MMLIRPRNKCPGAYQTVKRASQSSLRQQRKESESFSAGACTWQKIQLRLQVWNLFAYGEQIMRAADCKNWRKSPKGFFDKLIRPRNECPGAYCVAAFNPFQ